MNKILVLILVLSSLSTFAKDPKTEKRMREFSQSILKCLKGKDQSCLEALIEPEIYFPEREKFGCSPTKKVGHASATEFAECALKSEKTRADCGDEKLTLMGALLTCFERADSRYHSDGFMIQGSSGYGCHLRDMGDKLLLSGIGCGG